MRDDLARRFAARRCRAEPVLHMGTVLIESKLSCVPWPPSQERFAVHAAKRFGLSHTAMGRQAQTAEDSLGRAYTRSIAASFRSLPACLMKARRSLKRYSPTLPLLCRPRCHPGQLAVRGSHVSQPCQDHDFGLRHLRFKASHTLTGQKAVSAPRCSIAGAYPP